MFPARLQRFNGNTDELVMPNDAALVDLVYFQKRCTGSDGSQKRSFGWEIEKINGPTFYRRSATVFSSFLMRFPGRSSQQENETNF